MILGHFIAQVIRPMASCILGRYIEMAVEYPQLMLEKKAWLDFLSIFKDKGYPNQRLGQAFHTHFKLYKLTNQTQLKNLYEKDGAEARALICNIFEFN